MTYGYVNITVFLNKAYGQIPCELGVRFVVSRYILYQLENLKRL